MKAVRLGLAGLVLAAAGGCAVFGPPAEVPVRLAGTPAQNRDDEGRALSVVVRIHQLRDDKAFMAAPFDALVRRDEATLGDARITTRELVLIPGEAREERLAIAPETRYIGVVALFRRPDPARARRVFAVRELDRAGLVIRADACSLRVVDAEGRSLDPAGDAAVACPAPAPQPARPTQRRPGT